MSEHPEDTCDWCGRDNISWVVDSDRFNMAMEALGLDRGAIVCPVCFVDAHELAADMRCSWQLLPATPFRWIGEGERPPRATARRAREDAE